MGLYVRLSISFFTHRKTARLYSKIGSDAFWIPPRLWAYAAEHQPNGDFSDYTPEEIAMLVGYKADASSMLQALQASGFLDDMKIHGWDEHNRYHSTFSERAKKAAEVRWGKERSKEKKIRKERKGQRVRADQASPKHATSINSYKTRTSKPKNREEVIEFVREIGLPETDGHYYFDKWQGNGFRNNGQPIRDWKAVIRSHKTAGYLPSQKQHVGASSFQKSKQVDPNQQRRDEEYERFKQKFPK